MRKQLTDLMVARIAPPATGYTWMPDAWLSRRTERMTRFDKSLVR